MFLIAKIVRGRRLLHELEKQEKDEHLAADAAAQSNAQANWKGNESSPTGEERDPSQYRPKRSRTVRKKTGGGSVDSNFLEDGKQARKSSSMPSIYDLQQQAAPPAPALKHYNYDTRLSKIQKRAIRFTWHRLQTRNGGKRVENVFEEVFDKLVKNLPNIRDMFSTRMFLCAMSRGTTSTLRDHSKSCVKMIEAVIKNFDTEKSKRTDTGTENDPRVIGRAHSILKPYGLAGNYWEKFGEVMIDVVLAQEAVRDLPGAGQAWVIFTACLVDQMRAGFDENRKTDHEAQMKKNTVLHYATQQLLEDNAASTSAGTNGECSNSNQPSTSNMSCPFARMSLTPKDARTIEAMRGGDTNGGGGGDNNDLSGTIYL
uniref:GLOBIN domain-containing protein n=1 Tax=Caenorhabditis tropicalis TaxID=1561998 RepID=A0A1I7TWD1_9PELO